MNSSSEQKTNAQQLKRMIRILTASMGSIVLLTSGVTLGVFPSLAHVTDDSKAIIACGTSVTLSSKKEGKNSSTDYKNNEKKETEEEAKKGATKNAENNVKQHLKKQIEIISCSPDCSQNLGKFEIKSSQQANINQIKTGKNFAGIDYTTYHAKAEAKGTVKVSCGNQPSRPNLQREQPKKVDSTKKGE